MFASHQERIEQNKQLLLSSDFIFHPRLHFRCVEQMFRLRRSAVFFSELWTQPASHNTAHKPFLIYPPAPLNNGSLPRSPNALFYTY